MFQTSVDTSNLPYVRKEEQFLRLLEDYRYNQKIQDIILRLSKDYEQFQRVRGDGNCFYRAALYEYFRKLSSGRFEKTIKNTIKKINEMKEEFEELKKKFKVEINSELFIRTLKNIERTVIHDLMVFQKKDSDDLVQFIRVCVAIDEIRRKEDIQAFILTPFDDRLKKEVLEMGVEADHHEIVGFARFFLQEAEFSMLIRRTDRNVLTDYTYPDGTGDRKEKIELLYRPGHYDILIRK